MYCPNCLKFINEANPEICPHCHRQIKPQKERKKTTSIFKVLLIVFIILLLVIVVLSIPKGTSYSIDSGEKNDNLSNLERLDIPSGQIDIGSITFSTQTAENVYHNGNDTYCFVLKESESFLIIAATSLSDFSEDNLNRSASELLESWSMEHPEAASANDLSTLYFADINIPAIAYISEGEGGNVYNVFGNFIYEDYFYALHLMNNVQESEGTEKFVSILANSAYLTTGEIWSNGRKLSEKEDNSSTQKVIQNQLSDTGLNKKSNAETYTAGMYKVGLDIPSGEYIVTATEDNGYYCVSSDSNKDDIIENDFFSGNAIITVSAGHYFEVSNATFVSSLGNKVPAGSSFSDGTYRVGIDISAGEYKLTASEDSGYYAIYSSSVPPLDILVNDLFEGNSYVTVKHGEYLNISGCTAVKTR